MKRLLAGIVGLLCGLGNTAQALTLNSLDLDLITTSPADYNRASVSAVPVPGAIAGAGMPALVALGGLALWRRRKKTC